jgi:hypothetical protein
MESHSCYPTEEERVRAVEKTFGLHRKGAGGCLGLLIAAVCLGGGCLMLTYLPLMSRCSGPRQRAALSFVHARWFVAGSAELLR